MPIFCQLLTFIILVHMYQIWKQVRFDFLINSYPKLHLGLNAQLENEIFNLSITAWLILKFLSFENYWNDLFLLTVLLLTGCKDRFLLPTSFFQHIYRKSARILFHCSPCGGEAKGGLISEDDFSYWSYSQKKSKQNHYLFSTFSL